MHAGKCENYNSQCAINSREENCLGVADKNANIINKEGNAIYAKNAPVVKFMLVKSVLSCTAVKGSKSN